MRLSSGCLEGKAFIKALLNNHIKRLTIMKTKAVTISLLLFSFVCLTSCNNTGGKLEELEKQVNKIALNTANAEPIYRLYPTRNMWNFLKLDTRNGKISMVQFSVEDNEKQFEYVLSNKALCENTAPGRFMLQPTENIYNFIMLDQVSGQTYQVQWSFEEDKRFIIPIK